MPEQATPVADREFRILPESERTKPRIRAGSLLAATLLYLLLLAAILLWPAGPPPAPPAPIPVRIVRKEPPKPPATPPQPRPVEPPMRKQPLTESGESERTTAPAPAREAPEERKTEAARSDSPARAEEKQAPAPLPETSPTPKGTLSTAKPATPRFEPPKPEPPKPAARPSFSKKPAPPEHRMAAPKAETGDPYMNALRDEIERHRTYPPLAQSLGLAGVASYRLVIDASGRILSLTLVQSSGAEILDRTGREMILAAGRYPPPPLGRDAAGIVLMVRLPLYSN